MLDRCSGVGPVDLSKRVIAQDEKWDGGGCSETWQLEKNWNTSHRTIVISFWRKFTLTLTRDLGFKFLVVDMAFYFLLVCRRSPCKFSGFTWFAIVFVRPLPKHWKPTKVWGTSTCHSMGLARKEQRPGAWHGGLRLQASKRWSKMEFWDFSAVGQVFRCQACASFQKSHCNGMEARWKVGGVGCSDTWQLEKNWNKGIKQ